MGFLSESCTSITQFGEVDMAEKARAALISRMPLRTRMTSLFGFCLW